MERGGREMRGVTMGEGNGRRRELGVETTNGVVIDSRAVGERVSGNLRWVGARGLSWFELVDWS
jgi:hypothetical protein